MRNKPRTLFSGVFIFSKPIRFFAIKKAHKRAHITRDKRVLTWNRPPMACCSGRVLNSRECAQWDCGRGKQMLFAVGCITRTRTLTYTHKHTHTHTLWCVWTPSERVCVCWPREKNNLKGNDERGGEMRVATDVVARGFYLDPCGRHRLSYACQIQCERNNFKRVCNMFCAFDIILLTWPYSYACVVRTDVRLYYGFCTSVYDKPVLTPCSWTKSEKIILKLIHALAFACTM